MESSVEKTLLQERFPDVPLKECGRLLSDVFCARSIASHTYEGRLFVTEKALLFVSTYSDATVYDICIHYSDVTKITAFQKSVIPSLEITLTHKKERFTNFYNLSFLLATLKDVLPDGTTEVVQSSASQLKLQRLLSAPAQRYSPTLSPPPPLPLPLPLGNEDRVIQPPPNPCPFFIKSGFCPRQPLCKLDHGDHKPLLSGNPPSSSPTPTKIIKPTTSQPITLLRSPKKRFHLQQSSELEKSNAITLSNTLESVKKSKSNPSPVSYSRSISLPAKNADFDQSRSDSKSTKTESGFETGEEGPDRSQSDGALGVMKSSQDSATIAQQTLSKLKHETANDDEPARGSVGTFFDNPTLVSSPMDITSAPDTPREDVKMESVNTTPDIQVPKSFNFSDSNRSNEESQTKESNNSLSLRSSSSSPAPKLKDENGVFIFSATSPTSPDQVVVKRKNAAVSFKFDPEVIGSSEEEGGGASVRSEGVKGEGGDEEMVMLAQQLDLDSDTDSLHGDLDIESQRRLLASFTKKDNRQQQGASPSLIPPPPPPPPIMAGRNKVPRSSEGTDVTTSTIEGASGSGHKRHPCVHFLSGYCRNGLECPQYHGMDPDLEDFEYDDLGLIPIPPKLHLHSADTVGRSDIKSGDKIIVSPQVLMSCEQQELAYPFAFKMECPDSGKFVYAGVLEFTSPDPNSAYVPQWMMDYLGVKDGEEVLFEHVNLPKGQFVQLQPVSSAWLGIPSDKQRAMMEFQLRNFQTLTEGTKVTLTYELNRYMLKVLKCEPAKGISIVDADITTDIVEPADFSRFHSIEEGQAQHTQLDNPIKCSIEANTYRHFVLLSLPGQPLPSKLRIQVHSEKGDADLFVSQTCTAPSQRRYTWCDQDVGGAEIQLSTDEKEYDVKKPLYAGVVSLCEDTQFTLTFHREDTMAAAKARQNLPSSLQPGKTLRDVIHHAWSHPPSQDETDSPSVDSQMSHVSPTAMPPLAPPLSPGQERCSYCGSVMPSLRLLMHEKHCALINFKCPICKVCVPKSAEKKHHFISHELLTCECGQEYTQLQLHHHQVTTCTKRTIKCSFKWCNLSFPMDQIENHENLCGRKPILCPVCNQEVSQLQFEMHLEAFHSVDTRKIDWTKPLSSQMGFLKPAEPNFKCHCGAGFEFQDDLQVHQLTECSSMASTSGGHGNSTAGAGDGGKVEEDVTAILDDAELVG